MSLNFQEIVAQRRSVRDFHADPLSDEQIEQILLDAQQSPSSCNTQPWVVHVVSGDAKDRLSAALMRAFDEGGDTHDFGYDIANYPGVYAERRDAQAAKYYEALKIARSDTAARTEEVRRNLEFFNAPHVALIFIPNVVNGDVQNSADVGMYTQTFLLSLVSRGLGGIAQGMLSNFPSTIREELGIPSDLRLVHGISFGHANEQAKSAQVRFGRAPLSESVTFHR
ncbi:nitroreductase [Pseudomonas kurunegalensis]|uniref:nitroreductase n=1 Tax=Pseudomonas kurunegalensis TaxID=485880 RepID=UPI0025704CDF|nr:nitroreductase [Pseudomonas kurunegalensis]WJD60710.1 nitroreductase [Pseudomonas kurunegalensis]